MQTKKYLIFTSYPHGDHSNVIVNSVDEVIENMKSGCVDIDSEIIEKIRVNTEKLANEKNFYIEYDHGTWSTITRVDYKDDTKLISIDDVCLGVKIIDQNNQVKVVESTEADFDVCPSCGSNDIEYGKCDPDSIFIYREHVCICGCNWKERYDLVRVTIKGGAK